MSRSPSADDGAGPSPDEVRIERDGPVALLIVDRPKALNAIARHTMSQLAERVDTLRALADAGEIRAVVLCGGGDRFIAGGDLRDLDAARTGEQGEAMSRQMQRVLAAMETLTVPLIGAIERYAFGGGAEVAMACDLRVMAPDAVIAFRHGRFGVTTAWGGTRRLLRLVGRSRALDLLWTGRDVNASEARALGLADRVASPTVGAREAAVELARQIIRGAPLAVATTRRLVLEGGDLDTAAYGDFESSLFGPVWGHADHWDRVDRFWARQRARKTGPLPGPSASGASASSTSGEGSRMQPAPGRFIVFEGLDGAGTTTQAARLTAWLRANGRTVVQTCQPSDGPIGNMIRQALGRRVVGADGERLDAKAIAGLFVADRADHLRGTIEPALAAGHDVVCDRYLYSSLAYQGAEGDPAWIAALNAPFRAPDLVLYVEVPVEVAAQRRAARAGRADLYEVDDFQRRVAEGYARVSEWRPADPVRLIDGARDVESVAADCRRLVGPLVGLDG